MSDLEKQILDLADTYAKQLRSRIDERTDEMVTDDTSHYLIYTVLGISPAEGKKIDHYQNVGRFLYKYAGAFLEIAARTCLESRFPQGSKLNIPNTKGIKPKTFEIDFLNGNDAIEIKWRDATTDGDHITKEHTRVKVIRDAGYTPIRVMFYYPQREQAIRIQETLKTLYQGVSGKYYAGDEAWEFIKSYTGVDLKAILDEIAVERRILHGD
jgi:hypothetical protein